MLVLVSLSQSEQMLHALDQPAPGRKTLLLGRVSHGDLFLLVSTDNQHGLSQLVLKNVRLLNKQRKERGSLMPAQQAYQTGEPSGLHPGSRNALPSDILATASP